MSELKEGLDNNDLGREEVVGQVVEKSGQIAIEVETVEKEGQQSESEYAPHEQRVIDERDALEEKVAAIRAFIKPDHKIFSGLESADKILLRKQEGNMARYLSNLNERIGRFSK